MRKRSLSIKEVLEDMRELLAIDGASESPKRVMTLPEAVSLMRGKKGTEITGHVYREGFDEPRPYTVVRDVVQLASVSGEISGSLVPVGT